MFIIRDWGRDHEETKDDYPFGFEGGRKYFKETINPADGHAEEHEMMSEYLESTFGEIRCCLLPFPGEAVRSKNIQREKDLDEEFLTCSKQLFKQITAKEKLVNKKIEGQNATCAELCSRMEAFASLLKQDRNLEDAQSIIEVDYEAQMNNVTTKCAYWFLEKVQKIAESFRNEKMEDIEKKLLSTQEEAIKDYEQVLKPGGKKFQRGWLIEYRNLLSQIIDGFVTCAAAEKQYVEIIKEFNDWREKIVTSAKTTYDSLKEKAKKKGEELLTKFKNSICVELFEQCETYFKDTIKKLITYTKAEGKKYLDSLKIPKWATMLIMGALVVGGAALFVAVAPTAAVAIVVGSIPKAVAVGTAASKVSAAAFGVATVATAVTGAYVVGNICKSRFGKHGLFSKCSQKHATDIITPEEADEEFALTKYEESVIHIQLCFGQVQFRLFSKVKLM